MQTPKLSGLRLPRINRLTAVRSANNAASIKDNETQNLKSWKEIPGPPSFPLIGSLLSFLPGGSLAGVKGVELSERIYKRYGPIARIEGFAGAPNMVWLFDPDAIAHIHRSENTLPIRPGFASLDYYRKQYNKTYDPHRLTGLVSDNGENWREFRSKVNPIMLQPKTIKLYREALAEVAEDTVARMRSIRDENNMIKKKFDIEMNLWALESIGVVALGGRLNCLDPNLPDDSPAKKLIQNVHNLFDIVEKLDFKISPWRYISTPNLKKGMKIFQEQEGLANFFIDQAIKNMEESKANNLCKPDSKKPILEKLLEIDVEVALIMASDMLMAGVDTAANTATATFYLLSKNPEKQNKLREEVLTQQNQGPYLRACIKESMRMLPVVNGNARQTTKEYNLMGYKIPKDLTLVFGHQYMSILEEHYPRPKEFIPERWLAEKDDPLYHGNTHPFVNSPFGYGPRMCIGRRIAELEIRTFVAKAVENFQIDWQGAPPNITVTSLNYITEPFNFVFKDV